MASLFLGHYSGAAHVHTWRPTISRPNGHYDRAEFDLQPDAEMVVLATLGESNSEWHVGEKEVVHPEDVLNTNEEVTEWPFAVRWDNFSFAPAVRSSSWD